MTASPRRWQLHAALGLPALAFFAPVLFFGRALYHRDVGQYFYPHKALLAAALRHGHLAQWNPFEFGGMPLLVDPNFNAFHPLALLTDLAPMPWGFSLFVALNAWLAAWGAWWLAGELGLTGGGRLVAALCWAWSGPYVSLVESGQSIALSTLPWQIAAFVALARRPSMRAIAVAALASAIMLLSGTPEVGVCGFALGGLLALVVTGGQRKALVRTVGRCAAAVALALGLAAIQLLPTLDYMRTSSARGGGFRFGEATAYSLHPWRLLNLVLPFAFGELNARGSPYWSLRPGLNDPYIQEIYLGLLPMLLALVGLTVRSRPLRTLALAGAGFALLAFGSYTPLYKALWTVLPPIHSIRFPQKLIVPGTLALAMLAGAGWLRLRQAVESGAFARRRTLLAIASLLSAAIAGVGWILTSRVAAGSLSVLDPIRDRTLSETLLPSLATEASFAAVALFVLWALATRRLSLSTATSVGALLLALDLGLPALRMDVSVPAALLKPPAEVVDFLRRDAQAPDFTWRVDTEHHALSSDVEGFGDPAWPRTEKLFRLRQSALFGSSAILDGLYLAKGYSGFTTARMRAVYSSRQPREMVNLFGVRYGLAYGTKHASAFEKLGFKPLAELDNGRIRLWKNDQAGPKAWLTDALLPEQRIGELPRCGARPAVWVPHSEDAALPVVANCAHLAPTRLAGALASVERYEPETVVVETQAAAPALLVLNDVWAPGWSVFVDGTRAASIAADGAFRAVAVPAGAHQVRWHYETPGLVRGAVITAIALLILLGLALSPA